MRFHTFKSVVIGLSAALFTFGAFPAAAATAHARAATAYGKLPLSFEANEGQAQGPAQFIARGHAYSLFLTPHEGALRLNGKRGQSAIVRWQMLGGNPMPSLAGENRLAGTVSYFQGNDPRAWHTGIATYGAVRYASVYPGIDLVYHGNQRQVEYDFLVAPNADPGAIRIAFQGLDSSEIAADGSLILHTSAGDLVQPAPVVYQEISGQRRVVEGRYAALQQGGSSARPEIGFALGEYDHTQPLVIDPLLVYSTYLGGNDLDEGLAIAVDASGNAYLTGLVVSTSFAGVTSSSIQPSSGGDYEAFVTKINAEGTGIVYSTYLGGNGANEYGMGIAVDAAGSVYVTGATDSTNFPGVTSSSLQASFAGGWRDAFVTKINAAGDAIEYSTYLGGDGDDAGSAIAVDSAGNAYVAGATQSSTFPGVDPSSMQPSAAGGGDGFIAKINASGSAFAWSTFLGGSANDGIEALAIDSVNNVYVAGSTSSTTFPGVTSNSVQPSYGGGWGDAFVAKLTTDGALTWSTYLGDAGGDSAEGLAVDASGNVYVGGNTESAAFPGVTSGSIQPVNAGGGQDGFLTKLNSTGTAIMYSSFVGGEDYDYVTRGGVAVDGTGRAYIAGSTSSRTFTGIDASSMQSANAGSTEAFVTAVDASGASIVYSTFLGSDGDDGVCGIAVDAGGNAYITGSTSASLTPFPGVTGSSIQPAYGGGSDDGFVTMIGAQ